VPRFGDPEPLGSDHVLSGFECGVDSLNTWLPKHASSIAKLNDGLCDPIIQLSTNRFAGNSSSPKR